MISICVPVYIKNRELLKHCLDNIAKHTRDIDYELLVCMDGGSPDDIYQAELDLRETEEDHHNCKGVHLLHNRKVLYEAETVSRMLEHLDQPETDFVVVIPVMNEIMTRRWFDVLHVPFTKDSLCMLVSNEPASLLTGVQHYPMNHKDVIGHEAIFMTRMKLLRQVGMRFEDTDLFIGQKLIDEFRKKLGGRCWAAPTLKPEKLPYESPPLNHDRYVLSERRESTEVEVVL